MTPSHAEQVGGFITAKYASGSPEASRIKARLVNHIPPGTEVHYYDDDAMSASASMISLELQKMNDIEGVY